MDLKDSVVKLVSGGVVLAVIEFVAIARFTQILGTGPMGSFFVFQAVVGMLAIPIDLGISRAAEKHLSAGDPAGEVIVTAAVMKGLLALPWLIAVVLLAGHVERYIGVPGVVPLVVVGLLTSQARGLSLRLLAGQMMVEKTALLKVIGKLVWVGAGFVLIYAGWEASAVITAYILGNVVQMLGALVRMDLAVGWPRVSRAKELVDFGRYVFIGNLGGFIYQWMDVAILRLFVPVSLIGAYEIAWRVAELSMMLTEAIRTTLFPQISRWHSEGRIGEIESAFKKWLQVPLYLTIPAFAGAVILGRDVLATLFGADVVLAYPVLLVFMLEKILRSVQLVIGPSLYAMDKPQLGYRSSVAAIVANLVLNIALIPTFGLIGAAVATTLSAATAAFVALSYVSRFVEIQVPWDRVAWSITSASLMAAVVFVIRRALDAGWARVTVGVSAGVACYLVLLFANESIRLEMRGVIREYAS